MSVDSGNLRVRLLPSAVSGDGTMQYATSYLVGDSVAIDAGSVGLHGGVEAQRRVRHVLLTHSHTDHIASLPILLENTLSQDGPPLEVWAGKETLACLEGDVFNDRVWPRLEILKRKVGPAMVMHELESEREVDVGGLRVLPIRVDHTVPTLAFLVSTARASAVIAGDTGPTERLWQIAEKVPGLAAVFLEASFPDELHEIARRSMHLTPRSFALERAKLKRELAFVAVHLKPRFREQIVAELQALAIPGLEIGVPGKEYRW
ncbi:MAG TPA: 3',5'-cyclic-nucleotide phosphodiesterase [Planctomycetota bacterium]|nr:3',5'-cyclic-nucleotide phosphodiesterase [Planctomycetota bacterium]